MPPIEVIDLRTAEPGEVSVLSQPLEQAMAETLAAGNQTILFLNRRGYNASVLCSSCGTTQKCIHCSVSLTYHQSQGLLVCHYCSYSKSMPNECPKCQHPELTRIGLGTEQVEDQVKQRFPDARVARMDRDTITRMQALEDMVAKCRRKEIDILIGTQMIAKGHDFPGVTLVGVLLADMGLTVPDFRSAERSFQLLTQVAGRAGRSDLQGKVIVQTYQPEHDAIVYSKTHDYKAFYESEIEKRFEGGYPPHAFLVCLRFESRDPRRVKEVAQSFGGIVRRMLKSEKYAEVGYIGPAPAPIHKIKNRFRWQMILRSPSRRLLHHLSWQIVEQELSTHRQKAVKITIDADPVSML
jgi:primosomal protein N' (replication factor Y)